MIGWGIGWGLLAAASLLGMVRGPVPGDPADDDDTLVAAVRAGDATAYRGLVERYQGRVYHVIYGMVRDQEDARELTQDAFIKAYRNLHTFREDSRFYTWIYRIAMNLTIDFVRRRGKGPAAGSEEDVALGAADTSGMTEGQHVDSPRRVLERKELYAAILTALDKLPEDQKQVILLREIEGMSYKEIAEILDLAEGTVMSRLFYARKKLQAMLGDHAPGGSA